MQEKQDKSSGDKKMHCKEDRKKRTVGHVSGGQDASFRKTECERQEGQI
jgi:hypothetical protein